MPASLWFCAKIKERPGAVALSGQGFTYSGLTEVRRVSTPGEHPGRRGKQKRKEVKYFIPGSSSLPSSFLALIPEGTIRDTLVQHRFLR